MNRTVGFVVTAVVSLLVGGVAGAVMMRRGCDRDLGHLYVTELMDKAYVARQIYRGHSLELANQIRGRLPEFVLGVEKEFKHDDARDTAFRVVLDVYQTSNTEVPVEIRALLAAGPPRS